MTQPGNQGFRLPGDLGLPQLATHGSKDPQPVEHLPKTVSGALGTVPASQIDTTKTVPAAPALNPRQAQTLMLAELMSAVRSLVESSTELAGRLQRRGAINGVIESWAGPIPTVNGIGLFQRTYEVAVGSIHVTNLSAQKLIINAGQITGDTGGNAAGVGVSYVLPNQIGRSPIGDHSFAITGNPGDLISIEVFAGLQAYGIDGPTL